MLDINNTKDDHISVMIVAKPGLLRNSLIAYLREVTPIEIVTSADDALSAWKASRRNNPQVVLMDVGISEEETLWLVRQLRCEQPAVNMIVIADRVRQQPLFISAGANQVLLKGFLDERLCQAILRQVNDPKVAINKPIYWVAQA